MYIYESSPRRSPRHNPGPDSTVLKPKIASPIRKGKRTQRVPKPLASTGALASITGTTQKQRKVKVNDENKENSNIATQSSRRTGENTGFGQGKKKMPLGTKVERGRLPLKELPVNGFVEKMEQVASVEVAVF